VLLGFKEANGRDPGAIALVVVTMFFCWDAKKLMLEASELKH
jgi:hypothetical protein